MNLDGKQLGLVERWTLVLAAIVIAAATITMSRRVALGVSVGAAIMCLNAYAMRRLGQRVLKTISRPGFAILLFNAKMGLLIAVVYLALRFLPVDAIGFLVGVSVFPVAIVAAAIHENSSHAGSEVPPSTSTGAN